MIFWTLLLGIYPLESTEYQWSLLDTLAQVLCNDAQVESIRLSYDREEGALLESAEAFDPLLNLEASYLTQMDQISSSLAIRSSIWGHRHQITGSLRKRTRLGTRLAASVDITSSNNALSPLIGLSQRGSLATLAITFEQPLLRDFRHSTFTQQERAQKENLELVRYRVLQSVSEVLLETCLRYWALAASQEILHIQQEAEGRAQQLLENTRELIRLDEIPRNDENQALGQLERERINHLGAKQSVVDSYQSLVALSGIIAINDLSPHVKTDPLPGPALPPNSLLAHLPEIVNLGLCHRYDLNSLRSSTKVNRELLRGQYNERLPELNIFTQLRSVNFQIGERARSYPSILSRNSDEVDYTIGIRLNKPLCNSGARGRLWQQEAELERSELLVERTAQQIVTDIQRGVTQQEALAQQITHAQSEVEINRTLREGELEKLKAGSSTLFIVVDYEERLTFSRRQLVELKLAYAQGMARLYFLTGSLLSIDGCWEAYHLANLYTLDDLITQASAQRS